MKLHCPHCGVKGSTDDSYSGRKVKCPECKELFVVSPDMVIVSPEVPEVPEVPEAPEESVELADAYEELIDTPVDEALDEGESEETVLAESEEEVEVELDLEAELEPEEESDEEKREGDTVALEDEIEQEPYGIEKKQCWQCGLEESADESFITSNGRLYCTNCVHPDNPDVESEIEEEPVEAINEVEDAETEDSASQNETEPEEPATEGAWAKLKSFFKK